MNSMMEKIEALGIQADEWYDGNAEDISKYEAWL